MGFCVASTKNGLGSVYMLPRTVQAFSCMASSSALCVLGGVRLISSARRMLPKIGPCTKVQVRRPVAGSSSMMSVPVISLGIRSGVNWMRLKTRPSVCAMVRTSKVLAVPGRPVMRQWPPTKSEIITCSRTSSWPTMTRRTCVTISLCTWRKRAMRDLRASGSNCVAVDMFCPFLVLDWVSAQLQQKLLRGAEPRSRFESGQQFFLRLLVLFGGVIGAREVEVGLRGVLRIARHHGGKFADRPLDVALGQPQAPKTSMRGGVHGVDKIQPVQRVGGLRGAARLFQRLRQQLQ